MEEEIDIDDIFNTYDTLRQDAREEIADEFFEQPDDENFVFDDEEYEDNLGGLEYTSTFRDRERVDYGERVPSIFENITKYGLTEKDILKNRIYRETQSKNYKDLDEDDLKFFRIYLTNQMKKTIARSFSYEYSFTRGYKLLFMDHKG